MTVDVLPPAPNNVIALPGAVLPAQPPRVRLVTPAGFAGMMVLDLHIPQAQSLKDKRQPLRSVLTRLKNAGFSASEVDHHDKHQRAQIAVSIVGRGARDVEHQLDLALRVFDSRPDLDVTIRQRTVLSLEEYE